MTRILLELGLCCLLYFPVIATAKEHYHNWRGWEEIKWSHSHIHSHGNIKRHTHPTPHTHCSLSAWNCHSLTAWDALGRSYICSSWFLPSSALCTDNCWVWYVLSYRIALAFTGIGLLVVGTTMVGYLPNGRWVGWVQAPARVMEAATALNPPQAWV